MGKEVGDPQLDNIAVLGHQTEELDEGVLVHRVQATNNDCWISTPDGKEIRGEHQLDQEDRLDSDHVGEHKEEQSVDIILVSLGSV